MKSTVAQPHSGYGMNCALWVNQHCITKGAVVFKASTSFVAEVEREVVNEKMNCKKKDGLMSRER